MSLSIHDFYAWNDFHALEDALISGADANEVCENGYAVLHHAASNNECEIISLLIKHGADVNKSIKTKHGGGGMPLHYAAANGKTNAACLLIGHGADIVAIGNWGNTPLDDAVRVGGTQVSIILKLSLMKKLWKRGRIHD